MAQQHENTNAIYLRIIIGLLSVSGTLFSIIGLGIMHSLDDLKKQVATNVVALAVHTNEISKLTGDMLELQADRKICQDFRTKFQTLYAIKPDDIDHFSDK